MARLYICQSPYWNLPLTSKDKFARTAPRLTLINSNKTSTHIPAILYILAPSLAPPPAPANLTARYSKKSFQWIFKTVLEAKASVPAL